VTDVRREVRTLVFTDVVASTDRLVQVGDAAWTALLARHDGAIRSVLAAHGGREVNTTGDGFLAQFDGPAAAVQAAAAAVEVVAGLGLTIRVGMHTGEVESNGGRVAGVAVHLAARVMAAAGAGEVWVSSTVRDLVAGSGLGFADRGVHQLKGFAEGWRLFALDLATVPTGHALPSDHPFAPDPAEAEEGTAPASAGAPTAGSAPGRPAIPLPPAIVRASGRKLIGRSVELDRIARLLDAADGAAPVAIIAGEAGVGKTRLAAAAAVLAVERGDLVLFGRCDEGLRAPYQPFVEALGAYVGAVPGEELALRLGASGRELIRMLPALRSRVPGLEAPTRAEPETERWLIFEAAADFMRALAGDRRLVVVIDDLQWAAPASLLLLRHLARAGIPGLLMLATARPTDRSEPDAFGQALADLARDHLVNTISLSGLSAFQVAALVGDRVGHPADESFAEVVHAETGGNPFFVHELVSHLVDLGVISAADDRWPDAAQVERSGAPEGVRHVLTRRIGQLSQSARNTLVVASVAGGEFEAADIARASGDQLDGVVAGLEEANASGLVIETGRGPGGYRFAHALVRHTLVETVSALRRARLHWQLAEAMRPPAGRPSGRLNELAYHYRLGLDAGDPAVAGRWLQQAGDHALSQLAFEDAIEHYQGALAALDLGPDDPDRRYDLLAGLGESAAAISDFGISQTAWLAAAEIARTAGDPVRFVEAMNGYDYILRLTADDHLERLIAEGLELVGPADSAERAELLARRAMQPDTGTAPRPREDREAAVRDALAMARRLDDVGAQSWALGALFGALLGSSHATELLATQQEQLQLFEVLGLDRQRASGLRNLALAAIQLGQRADADNALKNAEPIARYYNRRIELHNVLMLGAAVAIAEGHFDESKALVAEARDIGDARNPTVLLGYGAQICAIRAEQGRTDRAIDALPNVVDARALGTVAWAVMRAGLCVDAGRLDEAAEQLGQLAANGFALIPRDAMFPLAIRYLAEIFAHLDDAEKATRLLPELLPYSGQLLVVTIGTSIEGAADRCLGQLYGLLGRIDDADRHFEAAWRLEEANGYAPLAARSRYWHARLLARSENVDDRQRALSLVRATESATSALGMSMLHLQALALRELLDRPGGP
jgi:class 3 adenylate cyclase/tetratricopeptide (TPR) repeat protein